MVLIILSIVCNVFPLVVLPLFYKNIPENIPAFVDLWGNVIVSMEKTPVSILRLPIMGIILSAICIIMYLIKLTNEKQKLNKTIWSIIAIIGSLKMGLTSLEVIFYENIETIKYFRMVIFVLVVVGILILVYGLIKMYQNKIPTEEYKNGINKNKIKIIGLIVLYIIIALMPMYYNKII